MLKILINNTKQFIEVDTTPNINITNHEVGELATITTPYSGAIELERTPYNVNALGGYSVLQITSSLPYTLLYGDVYIDDYFIGKYRVIIQKFTDSKIYINLSDNSKFFWDNIQKSTLGKNIQLPELNHSKDASTIQSTWTENLPFKYLIGDYGGLNSYIINGAEHNNIDFAQPSVRVSYLLDKVIKDAGLTGYTGVDMSKDFIVYPNSTEFEKVEGDSVEVGKIRTNTHLNYSASSDGYFPIPFDTSDTLNQPNVKINNDSVNTIEILKSGTFDFFFEGDAEARYYWEDNWGDREMSIESVVAGIYVNGEMTLKMTSIPYQREAKVSIILNAGDVVEIYNIPADRNYPNWGLIDVNIKYINMRIVASTIQIITNDENTFNLASLELIKEVCVRTLTYAVIDGTVLKFKSLFERYSPATTSSINYHSAVINEVRHTIDGIYQKNIISHNHYDERDETHDTFFTSNNNNITATGDAFKSKIYIDNGTSGVVMGGDGSISVPKLETWISEVKEKVVSGVTTIEVKYKEQKGRYVWLRERIVNTAMKYTSRELNVQFTSDTLHTYDVPYFDVIYKDYQNLVKPFYDNTVVYSITIHASALELYNTPQHGVLYYFNDLGIRGIISKITLKDSEFAEIELVKI